MSAKQSEFAKWFEEQHGKRPVPKGRDRQLRESIARGRNDEWRLNQCLQYDCRRESALYAWQARGAK